ncbi:MAG: family 20 glycosylhydrolase [Bacteroidaceae bacterium]|nr:family 20 glycosylhydrolase [Bacteroidaceae bacterium]
MKKVLLTLLLAVALPMAAQRPATDIIPAPAHLQSGQGTFDLSAATPICYQGKAAKQAATLLAADLGTTARAGKARRGTVCFVTDAAVRGAEAYTLDVTTDGIVARASTAAGLFYAYQTLRQLLPVAVGTSARVPALSIQDEPRFAYRGAMLDPCRHFLPVEYVKRQIDFLSKYKINRLHWHLTEDQGWRVEIKKYPKLTSVGSVRVEAPGDTTGGFYTQAEIRDVVAYAAQHHMEVIPELEMPGHELAAIAAYPHLSCRGDSVSLRKVWGVEEIVMCPGKEDMFTFLQDVIDELVPLFPSKLFHIGGDESPRQEWHKCPKCQARMKELGLTKEAQLQSYIIGRMEKYLAKKGKQIIGWDEILEGEGLSQSAIVMSWRGEEGGIAAAKMEHEVLMTPSSHGFYFDYYQGDPQLEESCYIGGYFPIAKVYAYDPVPAALRGTDKARFVLGVQANNWSEYTHNGVELENKLYPRALALSEVAWSPMETRDFADFCRRADGWHALRLQSLGIPFHTPQPQQPEGSIGHIAFTDATVLTLETTRPERIVYTLDGSDPTAASTTYTEPLCFTHSTTVRTACVLPCGLVGKPRTIVVEKMTCLPGCKVKDLEPGLVMDRWAGRYQSALELRACTASDAGIAAVPEKIRTLSRAAAEASEPTDYAAQASGYLYIPEDAVYEFSTCNHQLFIDGKTVVDNSQLGVPRHTMGGRQIALAKGYHRFSVFFLGGIYKGWPTYWDDARVKIRRIEPTASPQATDADWRYLGKDDFWH